MASSNLRFVRLPLSSPTSPDGTVNRAGAPNVAS